MAATALFAIGSVMSFHELATPALAAHTLTHAYAPSWSGPVADPQVSPVDQAKPQLSLVDRAEEETCPDSMVLVEGDYCPEAEQRCAKWMESPEKFSYARCAEFDPHPTCQRPREHRRFCIDTREYTPAGETLPAAHISFTAAASLCEKQDKRLCLESEWEFACEGEAMSPYPYGFVRDATACNFEKTELYRPDGSLRDLRDPSGAHPRCTSPFGVSDMVGNIDEWTVRESVGARAPHASALRGGWWMPGRNRCRGSTTAHDELYRGPQTGFRCCAWPR